MSFPFTKPRSFEQVQKNFEAISPGPEGAKTPTLATNWSAYGSGFGGPTYYRHNGRVYLSGMIKKSVAVVAGETVFTLPVGYRPNATGLFTVTSNAALGRIDVASTGAVILQVGNLNWVSLDGISFRHT